MNLRKVITFQIRHIVAEVCGWSLSGVQERTRIIHRADARKLLAHRIADALEVTIPDEEWPRLTTVGHLIAYVELQVACEAQESFSAIYEPAAD
jgi:hypothetical protein